MRTTSLERALLAGHLGTMPDSLAHLENKCFPYTTNCASTWHFADHNARTVLGAPLQELLRDANLVELGCGATPIIDEFPQMQLASYTGIDINPTSLLAAQRVPRSRTFPISFALEDPVQSLPKRAPGTIVSSALLDDSILIDQNYGRQLVAAIVASTTSNGLSIHVGMLDKYPYQLEKEGFMLLAGNATSSIYRKAAGASHK